MDVVGHHTPLYNFYSFPFILFLAKVIMKTAGPYQARRFSEKWQQKSGCSYNRLIVGS